MSNSANNIVNRSKCSSNTTEIGKHEQQQPNNNINESSSLVVDITEADCVGDKITYNVHTKTTIPEFAKPELSVVRSHEQFVLHDCLVACKEYASFDIPTAPPKPNFDVLFEKGQKLIEDRATMTKEEFMKMKLELEQEFVPKFKETVTLHQAFLFQLAAHPVLRNDTNFRAFLENDDPRNPNLVGIGTSLFKRFTHAAGEVLWFCDKKDVDEKKKNE